MVTIDSVRALVHATLSGDVESFTELTREPRAELFDPRSPLAQAFRASGVVFTLSASGVASILRQLRDGRIRPQQAQSWASFARHGYFGYFGYLGYERGAKRGIWPLSIEYGPCEDAIVEAISRLDELGDLIDGEISDSEIAELLAELERCDGRTPDSPPRP